MLGPFATASRFTLPFTRCRYFRTPPLSYAACASMSTTTTTTTTTTRHRGDRYGPIEWAQQEAFEKCWAHSPLRAAVILSFTRCRYCRTPAIAIAQAACDVHDNNDDNDNA